MTVLLPDERTSPRETGTRCALVSLEFVRSFRGCDAETVLYCVGDASHPLHLRWVFDVAVKVSRSTRRELRFWKQEVMQPESVGKWARPEAAIDRILGERSLFSRTALEVHWTLDATTISRLVRRRELTQEKWQITRASLAAFLLRRLQ